MWYIISNITAVLHGDNAPYSYLGSVFLEMKNKCWVTLCLYNAYHNDYVY